MALREENVNRGPDGEHKGRPADEGTLANSGGESLDKAGIIDTGYLNKKGTPSGQRVTPDGIEGHVFNQLPPGTDIAAQAVADIEGTDRMTVKKVVDLSYPGDGWD